MPKLLPDHALDALCLRFDSDALPTGQVIARRVYVTGLGGS